LAPPLLRHLRRPSHSAPRPPPPTLSLHDALPILHRLMQRPEQAYTIVDQCVEATAATMPGLKATVNGVLRNALRQREAWQGWIEDRKSTRLNSSHVKISYAVFCLKKKSQRREQLA